MDIVVNESDPKSAMFKRFLDRLETWQLCEIARSVYNGKKQAYTRDVAEKLLLAVPYTQVLSNKKLRSFDILKFLVLNEIKVDYTMPKEKMSSILISLIEKQLESEGQQTADNVKMTANNNALMLSQNNSVTISSSLPEDPFQQVPISEPKEPQTQQLDYEQEQLKQFINDFSKDFYVLLNNLGTPESYKLGNGHFFNRCMLNVKIINTHIEKNELFNDSEAILQCFLNIRNFHQIYFSPYLDGVKWEKDIHGLIKILIGGRIYQHEECVGTFEQMFSLGEEYEQKNTWKILNSSLVLISMVGLLTDGLTN